MSAGFHLAQLNIARMKAPLSDPLMAGFVARLEQVNAAADRSPGFVWRLQTDSGDATELRPFDDATLVNLSLWTSVEALFDYVYANEHLEVFRGKSTWFDMMSEPHLVLWWVPAGRIPSLEEAKERLEKLQRDGPTPTAFTFKQRFDPP